MATIKDILGDKTYEIEKELYSQGYNDAEVLSTLKNIARQTQKRDQLKKEYGYLGDEGIIPSVGRGIATNVARVKSLYNGVFDDTKFDLSTDQEDNENRKFLEDMEAIKEHTSRQGLSQKRIKELDTLNQESANAKGVWENVKAGTNTMLDTITHPSEWTAQGVVETLADPLNAISFGGAKLAGKFGRTLVQKGLIGASVGATEGATVNSGAEYIIAKGQGKSDEEAKKIAIQSAAGGAMMGGVFGTVGGLSSKKGLDPQKTTKPPENETNQVLSDTDNNGFFEGTASIKDDEINFKYTLEDEFKGQVISDFSTQKIIQNERQKESINLIQDVAKAEQKAIQEHQEIKARMIEANEKGATLEELIAIRDDIKPDEVEVMTSKIINGGEPVSKRLSGFRILEVLKDNLENKGLNTEEIRKKLNNENVSDDLANAFIKSYKIDDISILEDFISNKLEEHLEVQNTNIKENLERKIDIYNKEKILEDESFKNSIQKQELDKFLDESIGLDNINDAQKETIYNLNKIGLVSELEVKEMADFGHYNKETKSITIDKNSDTIDKVQTLMHEFTHSASVKLLENENFRSDVKSLMDGAKLEFKKQKESININAFKNEAEFIAEAFSDPYLAKKLNDIKLSEKLKKQFGLKEYVSTLWDAVVVKFSDVIYHMTGKRFKLDKQSYFGTLNEMMNKQYMDIEAIQKRGIKEREDIFSGKSGDVEVHKMARDLEDKYIENGLVNEKILYDEADNLPYPLKENDFMTQFKIAKNGVAKIKTVIGEVKIKPKYVYEHFTDNTHLQDRMQYSGAFLSTIKEPLFVVKSKYGNKETKVFYKPFKKGDDVLHMAGYFIDKKGNIVNSTFFDIKPNKLKKYIETEEKNLEYYRYSSSLQQGKGSPMPSQTTPTPKNEATNNTVNKRTSNKKVGKENNTLTYIYSNFSDESSGTTLGQPPLSKEIIPNKEIKSQGKENADITNQTGINPSLPSISTKPFI